MISLKGEVVFVHAMNAYRESIGIAALINRGVRLRRVVSFTPKPPNRRKGTQRTNCIRGWVGPGVGVDVL
jgi:hypothetical protein